MQDKYLQIALLYELSLSNLKYFDPKDNAKSFIQKLLTKKSLSFGAIWLLKNENKKDLEYELLYGLPSISKKALITISSYRSTFTQNWLHITKKSIFRDRNMEGHFAYIKIADIGIMELYTEKDASKLTFDNLNPLKDVIIQLGASIKAGQSYQNLENEVKKREQAQKLLKANQEKFQNIVNNIELGLLEVDNDEYITYANQAFLDFTGYSIEDLLGHKASKILVKDKEALEIIKIENAKRKKGAAGAYELPIIDKKGNRKYMIISGAPNFDVDGNIIGSIGIHLDITKQKLLSLENDFKDLRIKKLFDISLDALISMNSEGNIFEWSNQAANIFNYTVEEAINKKLSDLIIPEKYREAHEKGMEHFKKTHEGPVLNKRFEISAIRKGGEEFPIELTIFPIEHNGTFYFTAFVRDITELKNSRISLQQALEEQKKLNGMKSKFISMTSHELRTPLTTIKSNTEIINHLINNTECIEPDKIRKNIKRMDHNVNRLNQLIDNIMLIGKIGSEMVNYNPVPTKMHEFLINSALPNMLNQPELKITGKPIEVFIDHSLFTQVINNLTENAFKYSSSASKKPIIEVNFSPKGVQLKVKDFGIGIPKNEQEHLFETFFRASNVDNIQGTGLGLAIVKDFVNLHNGDISVKSKPKSGSIFTVFIPIKNK